MAKPRKCMSLRYGCRDGRLGRAWSEGGLSATRVLPRPRFEVVCQKRGALYAVWVGAELLFPRAALLARKKRFAGRAGPDHECPSLEHCGKRRPYA